MAKPRQVGGSDITEAQSTHAPIRQSTRTDPLNQAPLIVEKFDLIIHDEYEQPKEFKYPLLA